MTAQFIDEAAAHAQRVAELEGELEASARELSEAHARETATGEILKLIAASPADATTVFDAIAQSANRLIGGFSTSVWRFEGDVAHLAAYTPTSPEADAALRARSPLPLRELYEGAALARGESGQIPDTEQAPDSVRNLARQRGYRARMFVPLMRQGAAVGFIGVTRATPGAFAPHHVQLLLTFADQAVIAIENARQFNETREALERQTATAEILKVIAGSPSDVQPVFDAIAASAKTLLGGFSATVFRIIGDAVHLVAYTPTNAAGDAAQRALYPRPLAGSALYEKLGAGEFVHFADTEAPDTPIFNRDVARARGFRAVLITPLMKSGVAIGWNAVSRATPGAFSAHHIQLLQTFADQAVIAIENARLFNETQEALERQTATAEILKVIANSPTDARPVFEAIVLTAARLLHCDLAFVMLTDGESLWIAAAASPEGPHPIVNLGKTAVDAAANFPSRAILSKAMLHIPDWSLVEMPARERDVQAFYGINGSLYLPLLRGDACIGLLTLTSRRANAFGPADIAQAESFRDQAFIAIENARLFNETQEALERQTATANVLNVISRSVADAAPVFEAILDSCQRLFGLEAVAIYLVEGDSVRGVAQKGWDSGDWGQDSQPLAGSSTGQAIAERRPLHFPDIADKPGFPEDKARVVRAAGGWTVLYAPMLLEDRGVGSIVVSRKPARPFSEREIALVQSFADQASIAIQNARLFNETKAALEQQTATAEVLKVISRSAFDLQAVFDALLSSAVDLVGGVGGAIALREGDQLRFRAGANPGGVWPIDFVGHAIPIERSSAAGRAASSGRVEYIPDADVDPEFRRVASGAWGHSYLGVPLTRDGRVEGALTIISARRHGFTQRHIDLVQTFADQAVIAIENVRLFNEVQARTRDLTEALQQQTATAEVLKVISRSAFDSQAVLEALINSAVSLSGSKNGMIWLYENGAMHSRAFAEGEGRADFIEYIRAHPQGPGRGSTASRVALTGEVQNIADLLAEPDYSPEIGRIVRTRASLGVPMKRGDELVGAIVMSKLEPGLYPQRIVDLVKTFADQAVIAIENTRLFGEVQARTRDLTEALQQQTATADVLKVISRSAFDLQAVLDTLVESAARLCDADMATINRQIGDDLHMMTSFGYSREFIDFMAVNAIPAGRGSVAGRTILAGKPVQLPDALADPDFAFKHGAIAGGLRTMLGVPLLREGNPIGVIVLSRKTVRPFATRQIELAQTFADQAVIAIENTRLFEEVQARTRDLSEALQQQTATADVLKVISRSPSDIGPVLDAIAETAARLCGSEMTMFFRFDGQAFRILASWNFPPDVRAMLEDKAPAPGHPSALGRAGAALKPVYIADVLEDPGYGLKTEQDRARYRATLAVPMLREGKLVGALSLNHSQPHSFTPMHIELVSTFADQAAIAFENVRLFEEVRARTRDLEEALAQQTATADVLKVISRSAFDLDAVFQTLVTTAVDLCKASSGTLCVRDGELFRYRGMAGPEATPQLQRYLEQHPLDAPSRKTMAGRAILSGRTEQIADVLIEQDYDVPFAASGSPARALLGVPLLGKSDVLGAIVVARAEPGDFPTRHIEILRTFADQAVIAIENARLFEEVQARTTELTESLKQQTATSEVLKVISSSTFNLQPVFDAMAENAVRLCEAERAVIFRFDGNLLRAVATHNVSPELRKYLDRNPIAPGRNSISARAALYQRTIQIADAQADPEYTYASRDVDLIRTIAAIPMLKGDLLIGTITLYKLEANPFTDKQIKLVETFAEQAVIAVENVRLFDELQSSTQELSQSLDRLRKAQDRLVQSEKLASLGQLTAGIAHEIKNPLNFVNNFSQLSRELLDELRETLAALPQAPSAEADELIGLIGSNLDKVVTHGKRADSIVKNMLLHSREGSGERSSVNVNAMVEEALNLAYHGARAEKPGFNVSIEKALDPKAGEADLYPQEMTRVLLNLISNGFYATTKRGQSESGSGYEPAITASTRDLGDSVEICVADNGTGVPEEVKAKMFNPFFTTKPAGEGTGLGLSLSHDIVVKQHGGTLDVATEPGAYTQFTIRLPRAGLSK